MHKQKQKLIVMFLLTFFFLPTIVNATATKVPTLSIPIKGVSLSQPMPDKVIDNKGENQVETVNIKWIAEYISGVYSYALTIASILAVMVIMIGGFIYATAAGRPDKIQSAKSIIFGAISGLVLLLSSYLMLRLINPDLVELRPIKIQIIENFDLPDTEDIGGDCSKYSDNPSNTGATGELESIAPGKFMQPVAAKDFRDWMAEFGKRISINSAYRSGKKQQCLYETLPKGVAGRGCKGGNHEVGLAVDLGVAALSTEDYKLLLDTGKNHNFRVFWKWTGANVPTSLDKKGREEWRKKIERWHFDYTGGGNRDLCTYNPQCSKCQTNQ